MSDEALVGTPVENSILSKTLLGKEDALYLLPEWGGLMTAPEANASVMKTPHVKNVENNLHDDCVRAEMFTVYATCNINKFAAIGLALPQLECDDEPNAIDAVSNEWVGGTHGFGLAARHCSLQAENVGSVKHVGSKRTYVSSIRISPACGFEHYSGGGQRDDGCDSNSTFYPLDLPLCCVEKSVTVKYVGNLFARMEDLSDSQATNFALFVTLNQDWEPIRWHDLPSKKIREDLTEFLQDVDKPSNPQKHPVNALFFTAGRANDVFRALVLLDHELMKNGSANTVKKIGTSNPRYMDLYPESDDHVFLGPNQVLKWSSRSDVQVWPGAPFGLVVSRFLVRSISDLPDALAVTESSSLAARALAYSTRIFKCGGYLRDDNEINVPPSLLDKFADPDARVIVSDQNGIMHDVSKKHLAESVVIKANCGKNMVTRAMFPKHLRNEGYFREVSHAVCAQQVPTLKVQYIANKPKSDLKRLEGVYRQVEGEEKWVRNFGQNFKQRYAIEQKDNKFQIFTEEKTTKKSWATSADKLIPPFEWPSYPARQAFGIEKASAGSQLLRLFLFRGSNAEAQFVIEGNNKGRCESHYDAGLLSSEMQAVLNHVSTPFWIGEIKLQNGLAARGHANSAPAQGAVQTGRTYKTVFKQWLRSDPKDLSPVYNALIYNILSKKENSSNSSKFAEEQTICRALLSTWDKILDKYTDQANDLKIQDILEEQGTATGATVIPGVKTPEYDEAFTAAESLKLLKNLPAAYKELEDAIKNWIDTNQYDKFSQSEIPPPKQYLFSAIKAVVNQSPEESPWQFTPGLMAPSDQEPSLDFQLGVFFEKFANSLSKFTDKFLSRQTFLTVDLTKFRMPSSKVCDVVAGYDAVLNVAVVVLHVNTKTYVVSVGDYNNLEYTPTTHLHFSNVFDEDGLKKKDATQKVCSFLYWAVFSDLQRFPRYFQDGQEGAPEIDKNFLIFAQKFISKEAFPIMLGTDTALSAFDESETISETNFYTLSNENYVKNNLEKKFIEMRVRQKILETLRLGAFIINEHSSVIEFIQKYNLVLDFSPFIGHQWITVGGNRATKARPSASSDEETMDDTSSFETGTKIPSVDMLLNMEEGEDNALEHIKEAGIIQSQLMPGLDDDSDVGLEDGSDLGQGDDFSNLGDFDQVMDGLDLGQSDNFPNVGDFDQVTDGLDLGQPDNFPGIGDLDQVTDGPPSSRVAAEYEPAHSQAVRFAVADTPEQQKAKQLRVVQLRTLLENNTGYNLMDSNGGTITLPKDEDANTFSSSSTQSAILQNGKCTGVTSFKLSTLYKKFMQKSSPQVLRTIASVAGVGFNVIEKWQAQQLLLRALLRITDPIIWPPIERQESKCRATAKITKSTPFGCVTLLTYRSLDVHNKLMAVLSNVHGTGSIYDIAKKIREGKIKAPSRSDIILITTNSNILDILSHTNYWISPVPNDGFDAISLRTRLKQGDLRAENCRSLLHHFGVDARCFPYVTTPADCVENMESCSKREKLMYIAALMCAGNKSLFDDWDDEIHKLLQPAMTRSMKPEDPIFDTDISDESLQNVVQKCTRNNLYPPPGFYCHILWNNKSVYNNVVLAEGAHPTCLNCKNCMMNKYVIAGESAHKKTLKEFSADATKLNFWDTPFVDQTNSIKRALTKLGITEDSYPYSEDGYDMGTEQVQDILSTLKRDEKQMLEAAMVHAPVMAKHSFAYHKPHAKFCLRNIPADIVYFARAMWACQYSSDSN